MKTFVAFFGMAGVLSFLLSCSPEIETQRFSYTETQCADPFMTNGNSTSDFRDAFILFMEAEQQVAVTVITSSRSMVENVCQACTCPKDDARVVVFDANVEDRELLLSLGCVEQ